MTDLERARELYLGQLCPCAEHTYEPPYERIADALAAARREGAEEAKSKDAYFLEHAKAAGYRVGAEEMRERAAQVCDLEDCVRIKASALAADIRALPLTPGEQG